jgi:hypothetical protein
VLLQAEHHLMEKQYLAVLFSRGVVKLCCQKKSSGILEIIPEK